MQYGKNASMQVLDLERAQEITLDLKKKKGKNLYKF